ncbi:MAG: aminopeptidase P family N-terminal domain-containing protein, partial [Deferrisomatales bacterium]
MSIYRERVARATRLMAEHGMDALILVKPANMYYLVGDGRLCAYAMITRSGEVGMGVPETDLADVRALADFDHLAGFDDEVGMIHSIARYFKQFGIQEGTVGVEVAFLPKPRMGMLTHP